MSIEEGNLKYWVALSVYPKIGPIRFKKLFDFFKNTKLIWQAEGIDLLKAGLEEHIIIDFIEARKKIHPEKELEKNLKENIKIITIENKAYPQKLRKIDSPPFVLYYKGNLNYKEPSLAIIGTRKMSLYGKQVAGELTRNICRNNITTISGMALGIDSIVHKETIRSNDRTVAVLGSGLDEKNIYPKINYNLSKEIIDSNGLLISEYSAGTPGLSYNFPQRNRIISGLSSGLLVIESALKGGSLITVNYAKKQNKKIFAIPGPITSNNSAGTNNLIKTNMAKMITSYKDILDALELKQDIAKKQIDKLSNDEESLLNFLTKSPLHIDEIIKKSKIKSNKISSLLIVLELKGLIENLGNMNYATKS
jgi:DNA processing protein